MSNKLSNTTVFDLDSYPILIDNCCTTCIINCIKDFCNSPWTTNLSINKIGGNIGITMQGTIKWTILDNLSKPHTFKMTNSYFVPDAPQRLFSPQHWSQTAFTDKTQSGWASTYHDCVVLCWNQDKFQRTISLDKRSNEAKLTTAHGSRHFKAYKSLVQSPTSDIIPICFNVNMVHTDTEDEIFPQVTSISTNKGGPSMSNPSAQENHQPDYLATDHNQQNENIPSN